MSKRHLLLVFLLAALAVGMYFGFQKWNAPPPVTRAPSAIPVKTGLAKQADMPVFIRSIGTVVSPHSVQVRPQIDGTLLKVLVKEGQTVKSGDLLAQIDDRAIKAVLQQQRAELANRKAQLDMAELDLKRYQQLSARDAISGQSVDQQQALVNQLKQAVLAQLASIKEQEVKLSYTQIHAPMSGVVGIAQVHQGNYIRVADSGLFSIVQVDPISIEVALTQNLLTQLLPIVRAGSLEEIPVFAYDKDEKSMGSSGRTPLAQGHLVLIDNQVSAQTGTIRVRARFDNPDMKLWTGQTVAVLIELQQMKDVIVIPQEAIQQGNQTTYVWCIQDDKAQFMNVQVLQTNEGFAAITGLDAGAEVVLDGVSRLARGSLIQRVQHETPSMALESKVEP